MDWSQFQTPRKAERALSRRILIVGVTFTVLYFGVGLRLFYLHEVKSEKLKAEAEKLRRAEELIPALRGSIYDHTGELLAQDRTLHDVIADKVHMHDVKVVAESLALSLGVTVAELKAQMDDPQIVAAYLKYVSQVLAPLAGKPQHEFCTSLQPGGRKAPSLAVGLEKEGAETWKNAIDAAAATLPFGPVMRSRPRWQISAHNAPRNWRK